jgi:hypothetical protein
MSPVWGKLVGASGRFSTTLPYLTYPSDAPNLYTSFKQPVDALYHVSINIWFRPNTVQFRTIRSCLEPRAHPLWSRESEPVSRLVLNLRNQAVGEGYTHSHNPPLLHNSIP